MLKKLRRKFVLIMMTIFTVMLAVIFTLILHQVQNNYVSRSCEHMNDIAAQQVSPERPFDDRVIPYFPHFSLELQADGQFMVISGEEFFDLSDREHLFRLLSAVSALAEDEGLIEEYELRYLRVPQPDGGLLVVFMDCSAELASLSYLQKICLIVGIVSLVIFLSLSLFLAELASKPAEKVWEEQRQFIANASHELKTPLAVITTNAELLASPDYSSAEKDRFSENLLITAKQMRRLIESLLDLARVDNGTLQMHLEPLALSELIENALLPFEPLCYESSLSLESSIAPDLHLTGSVHHLTQLLEILLDNALKYSVPDTTVQVRLERQGQAALLCVSNHGESISIEDQEQIFTRFFRTDKSRSQRNGYGLGLAIAYSIVLAHKGRIWLESADGVNRFYVRLPLN